MENFLVTQREGSQENTDKVLKNINMTLTCELNHGYSLPIECMG